MSALVLISGPMASGKTSLCKILFRAMREEGIDACAIIQENQRDSGGYPMELRLIALPGGERRFLGGRKIAAPGVNAAGNSGFDGKAARVEREPFDFDDSTFAWASDKIREAAARGREILIIDEIGPLEIQSGRGLMPALAAAAKPEGPTLVLSVRPALEEELLRRLPELESRPLLRISLTPGPGERDLFFQSRDIIRHCQDNK